MGNETYNWHGDQHLNEWESELDNGQPPNSVIHELKTLPKYFNAIVASEKQFELRKNDRNFQIGDPFVLREWNPDKGYTGRYYVNKIDYVLKDCREFGLMDGYCIFGW